MFPARVQRLGGARSVSVTFPNLSRARGAATQRPLHRALRRTDERQVTCATLAELISIFSLFVLIFLRGLLPWPSRSSAVLLCG